MTMRAVTTLVPIICACLLSSACGIYRGLPSHGGGKRFDEEQRAVSAAVRSAIGALQLDELRGLAVQVRIENIAHSGGGDMIMPGPERMGINLSRTDVETSSDLYRIYGPNPDTNMWTPERLTDTLNRNLSGNLQWRLAPHYSTRSFSTDPDMNYLRAALHMRLLHEGIRVVNDRAEAQLTILVDVLGTNLSRTDALLWMRDNLAASCELTYYATTAQDQNLLFAARRTGAEARYSETGIIICAGLTRSRSVRMLDERRLADIPVYTPIASDPPPEPGAPVRDTQ